jgi:RNA polymerase sigma-70 factor (sigma-E family)
MTIDEDFSAYAGARWAALVRSAIVLGCTLDEAHDLAQTTLIRCYTAWDKVQRADNPDAYVYRTLLNRHRDSRRRRWWGERPSATVPDRVLADETTRVDTTDAVHRALGNLSKVNREVVVLRYYANLSDREVAEVLGIAPGTVKSRMSRALHQLGTNPHLSDLPEGQPS